MNAKEKAQEYLNICEKFKLGDLPTEQSNPITWNLSEWAKNNLKEALASLVKVDRNALDILASKEEHINNLNSDIKKVLNSGGRIFLCGCGATGRLSLSLETLWNNYHKKSGEVISFMAGGDTALVHALEGFEDYPEYGKRQLLDLGFSDKDLLISCTEGGETPFVIGATLAASELAIHKPYFLYCNPDDILIQKVERSKNVILNSDIKKINLTVGPMALSGSTRMQASTVLMLAVGLALFDQPNKIKSSLIWLLEQLNLENYLKLIPFIESESDKYLNNENVTYHVDEFAITVFTDTTERSPTFSLPSFDNGNLDNITPSPVYVCIDKAKNSRDSWNTLLSRNPRPLNWSGNFVKTSDDYLFGFDFSPSGNMRRAKKYHLKNNSFKVNSVNKVLNWEFNNHIAQWNLHKEDSLSSQLLNHVFLKVLLNSHSTLLMGRLNRYEHNFMTWVKPTNGKLIDRSVRYIQWMLKDYGVKNLEYGFIVNELFKQEEKILPNESIVILTVNSILENFKN